MTPDTILIIATGLVVAIGIIAVAAVLLRRHAVLRHSLADRERLLARLTERFGDAEAFIDFARSPEAERLFQTVDGPTAIARRLLALTAAAIVVVAAGAAFLLNSLGVAADADINLIREAQFARWWGVMLTATGVGLGVAVALCTRLARRWGLLGQ